jgi:hypothetical protein
MKKATGKKGAGGLASLVCRELDPDSPADHNSSHNNLSIVLAQRVVLPPRSRVFVMVRMLRDRQDQDLPRSVVVEPVHTKRLGV